MNPVQNLHLVKNLHRRVEIVKNSPPLIIIRSSAGVHSEKQRPERSNCERRGAPSAPRAGAGAGGEGEEVALAGSARAID